MDTQIRINISTRESFADGMTFGDVGAYERLAGEVAFAIDPESPHYSMVVDIENATRNEDGLVEFATDFTMLKPVERAGGNRRILHDVNNRGNLRALQFFNDAVHSNAPSSPEHAGNGFLMRRGYSIVWSGWQGDLLPGEGRQTMRVPTARDNGSAITGVTRSEFIVADPGVTSLPLSSNDYTISYEAASIETAQATFTVRAYETDQRQAIASDAWRFARVGDDGSVVDSAADCYLPEGFKPGWIYELVYEAKNPLVLGLGFTGLRDLISFLLHDDRDSDGTPNPLRDDGAGMERAYAWGRSQSGRFLREFVYQGYNSDTKGRRVFDGISPHVAGGGRVMINYRFAQPGRHSRQHVDHLFPCDHFPFAYSTTTDHLTGKTDGLLKRPETDPFVIHTHTSAEYWERRASLVHTDSLGNDIPDHERARVFFFTGSQHNADPLAGPKIGVARHPSNPLNTTPLLRALLNALDAWSTDGTAPPDSRVPRRDDETAVEASVAGNVFPAIPGVVHPDHPNRLFVQDHGPDFDAGFMAIEPPAEDHAREYAVLIPQVDSDGIEVSGLRTPQVEVPLATFTGWNYRVDGSAPNALAGLTGSHLLFAATEADREKTGDPRPSLKQRYGSKGRYVRLIALAAQHLVEQRLLLEEDADRYVEIAMQERIVK
ncbi:MAG: alpha/beta hydrolase domain-containing protein [SAR202 cluster bacterium]|nr:alpha/beta hydrolase domain-containing protein [SAR202 cluster bacterium]